MGGGRRRTGRRVKNRAPQKLAKKIQAASILFSACIRATLPPPFHGNVRSSKELADGRPPSLAPPRDICAGRRERNVGFKKLRTGVLPTAKWSDTRTSASSPSLFHSPCTPCQPDPRHRPAVPRRPVCLSHQRTFSTASAVNGTTALRGHIPEKWCIAAAAPKPSSDERAAPSHTMIGSGIGLTSSI